MTFRSPLPMLSKLKTKSALAECVSTADILGGGVWFGSSFHRDKDKKMVFRPPFQMPEKAKVLVVEDIVTTGGSVFEVLDLVREVGGEVVGVSIIVDRSNGKIDFGVKQHALLTVDVVSYKPEACPLCKDNVPMSVLGSNGKK